MFCSLCLGGVILIISVATYVFYRVKYLEPQTIGDLKDRAVFITGCDTGFGRQLALQLAQRGAPVFAGCLTDKATIELAKESKSFKGRLTCVKCDVTSDESVDKACEFVKSRVGNKGLWGVVSNAGIFGSVGPDDWQTLADYQRCLDVNLLGLIRVVHAFKPLVKKTKGRVVAVTSILGRMVLPSLGPYCFSKYAADAYCDVLRHELRPFGVSVHILEPGGFTSTGLLNVATNRASLQHNFDRLSDRTRDEYGEEFLKKLMASLDQTVADMSSPNIQLVVDAYLHALTSRHARHRYYPGNATVYGFLAAIAMPTCLQDALMNAMRVVMKADFEPAAYYKKRRA